MEVRCGQASDVVALVSTMRVHRFECLCERSVHVTPSCRLAREMSPCRTDNVNGEPVTGIAPPFNSVLDSLGVSSRTCSVVVSSCHVDTGQRRGLRRRRPLGHPPSNALVGKIQRNYLEFNGNACVDANPFEMPGKIAPKVNNSQRTCRHD